MIDYHGKQLTWHGLSKATGIPRRTLQHRDAAGVRGEALWSPDRRAAEGASVVPREDLKWMAREERRLKAEQAAKEKKRANRQADERAKRERLKAEIRHISSLGITS